MNELLGIIILTLFVNISATLIAMFFGVIIGYKLFFMKSPIKKYFVVFNRTMMSLPPVVLGLVVYLLFRRSGIFAFLELLYTVKILVLTQVLLVTPIIAGHFYDLLDSDGQAIMYYLKALGANRQEQFFNMIVELKSSMIIILTIGFSRAVSEVGAIMITGGNIKGKTRMMTTSISMFQSQGEINKALTLGLILLIISFIIQGVLEYFKEN